MLNIQMYVFKCYPAKSHVAHMRPNQMLNLQKNAPAKRCTLHLQKVQEKNAPAKRCTLHLQKVQVCTCTDYRNNQKIFAEQTVMSESLEV